MADESAESVMDAELATLLGAESKPAASAAAVTAPKGAAGETPPAVASPAAGETPAGEEDPLLKALDEIEEEPEVKPEEKPALSTDQQAVLEAIPDIKTATNLYNVVQNYHTFTGALESGKFNDVESMLTEWNPKVLEAWVEHVYEKNKVAFVDRFIAENDPARGPENKALTALQKEFNQLKTQLEDKKKVSVQEEAQTRVQQSFQAYNVFVNDLFDKINFNKADRRWVTADLNNRVAADPKVLAAVKSGDTKKVIPLFKAACKEYATRDKEVVTGAAEKVTQQEKKKAPLGGGAAEAANEIPDDIKQVKKGDEDKWLDKALGALFKKK